MAERLASPDHNTAASKSTFLAYLRKASPAKTAVEEARSVYNHIMKAAKKDGVNTKELAHAMAARKLDPEDVARDARDFQRYMAWMNLPIGAQTNLFGEEEADERLTDTETVEQLEFDAGEAGYGAGRGGQPRDGNPHSAGTSLYDEWDRQWLRGQAFLASSLGPGIENVGAPKRGRGRSRKNPAPAEASAE